MKFPTKHGIIEIHGDQSMAQKCQIAAMGHMKEAKLREKNEYFQVGAKLPMLEKVELVLLLISNLDIFA